MVAADALPEPNPAVIESTATAQTIGVRTQASDTSDEGTRPGPGRGRERYGVTARSWPGAGSGRGAEYDVTAVGVDPPRDLDVFIRIEVWR